jgi:hypothetical protein
MNYFLHPIVIEGKGLAMLPSKTDRSLDINEIILGTGLETTMGS